MSTVRIAGGGIAGMVAAINLAKAGRDVEILEKRSDVGVRFHEDFQFLENWSQELDVLEFIRRMNVKVDWPILPINQGRAFDYSYREFTFRTSKPVMYMVRRGRSRDCLDTFLKAQVLDAGVKIRFNNRVRAEDADIIATGPRPRESLLHVRGVRFKTNLSNDIRVLFDPEIAPGAYAYMVVHNRDGVICTVFTKEVRAKKSGREFIQDATRAFQSNGPFEMQHDQLFGNYLIAPIITNHQKIIAGEAAGFQDVCWGFGMRLAMLSGYLAAQSLIRKNNYWEAVRGEILPCVATTAFNRLLLENSTKLLPRLLLQWMGKSKDPANVLRMIYKPYCFKTCLFKLLAGHFRKRQQRH